MLPVLVLVLHRDEGLVEHVVHLRELFALLGLSLALERQAVARAAPADGGEHKRAQDDAASAEDDQVDEELPRVAREVPRRVLALQTRVRVRAPAVGAGEREGVDEGEPHHRSGQGHSPSPQLQVSAPF